MLMEGRKDGMTDMLKTVYPLKLHFAGGIKKVYTQTHTHTNIVTEKTKTIYPLYTSYTGGIINDSNVSKKQYRISAIENKSLYLLDDPRTIGQL